jgi:methylamine---glutamate N-methyltransferase subunit B
VSTAPREITVDLSRVSLRDLHHEMHGLSPDNNQAWWHLINPRGAHSVAVGLNAPVTVTIDGHVGYYAGGMNALARVLIKGNAGPGVAENMMSGEVRVAGDASMAAGSSGCGGLLVIDGNAGARCGISLKGLNIVVRGSVGHMSAFMAQQGNLVVCGDAGDALGDSLYEARIFVRGEVKSLGADCENKPMGVADRAILEDLLARAGYANMAVSEFRLFGSARRLYHFRVDNAGSY